MDEGADVDAVEALEAHTGEFGEFDAEGLAPMGDEAGSGGGGR